MDVKNLHHKLSCDAFVEETLPKIYNTDIVALNSWTRVYWGNK
jgi:hypothetical protein